MYTFNDLPDFLKGAAIYTYKLHWMPKTIGGEFDSSANKTVDEFLSSHKVGQKYVFDEEGRMLLPQPFLG